MRSTAHGITLLATLARPSCSSCSHARLLSSSLTPLHTRSLHTGGSLQDRGLLPEPRMLSQLQAKGVRPYFYYIDIHGQVFLQDTYPKNFTSCFKDPKFLDFFMARIKRNTTEVFPEYTWQSPCGKEINFVEAADTPIVFHGLRDGHLVWAGTLRTPFLPDQLSVSESTGRIYHPLPPSSQGLARLQSAPDKSKHRGCALGLLKSSLVLAELAASLDQDSLIWHGQHYDLTRLP